MTTEDKTLDDKTTFNERQVTDGAGIFVVKRNGVVLATPEELVPQTK